MQGCGQGNGEGFVGVVGQQVTQPVPGHAEQQFAGRLAAAGVQAQIQRSIGPETKTPCRVVNLHGRHAQVGQHKVKTAARLRQQSGQFAEVGAVHDERLFAKAQFAQPRCGARQLNRVHIHAKHAPTGLHQGQYS